MSKIKPISGFPEWLPEQRMVEQQVLDDIRRWFERFGFAPIDTRSVEPLDVLMGKGGDTDKEIYALKRAAAQDGGADKERLGLRFDLTVPLARYVVQNRGKLSFPFRRYQIQKVWRGERPQAGRYREFYQADIDVIGDGELPLSFDAEMPGMLLAILDELPSPPVRLLVNNRKLMEGFYVGSGIAADRVPAVLRTVDKLEKIGDEAVARALVDEVGLTDDQAQACLALADVAAADPAELADSVRSLDVADRLLDKGLDELSQVLTRSVAPAGRVVADLRIARGLDYYTGTVYEGIVPEWEESTERLGTVCSGGRYDNLAGGLATGKKKVRLPGVGVSIGVSRLLGRLIRDGALAPSRTTPTCVLVALPSEERRADADAVAWALRRRGVPTEVWSKPQKYGKQIKAAQKREVPFVWFLGDEGGSDEVRDIRTGDQQVADPALWMPPEADRLVSIRRSGS